MNERMSDCEWMDGIQLKIILKISFVCSFIVTFTISPLFLFCLVERFVFGENPDLFAFYIHLLWEVLFSHKGKKISEL